MISFSADLCIYLWSGRSGDPGETLRERTGMRMSCCSAETHRKHSESITVRTGGPLGSTGLKPLLPSRPEPSRSWIKPAEVWPKNTVLWPKDEPIRPKNTATVFKRLNSKTKSTEIHVQLQVPTASFMCFQFLTQNLISDTRNMCEQIQEVLLL